MNQLAFPNHFRSPHAIAALVACWHGVTLEDLAGRDPSPALTTVRQELAVLLSEFTGLTQYQIGVALGDRSETTVSHWVRSMLRYAEGDQATAHRLTSLRSAVLHLPGEAENTPAVEADTPTSIARLAITSRPDTLFEKLALSVLTAVEVLRTAAIGPDDARRAALSILTGQGDRDDRAADIIPLKGYVK